MSIGVEPRAVPAEEVVEFTVIVSGSGVQARITREALEDHFGAGASPESWVRAYVGNAARIHRAVEGLVQGGVARPVIVRTAHF